MNLTQKKFDEAIQVIKTLEAAGFDAQMAGGCVRDRLLGVAPRDFDVATNAAPDQVCKVFEQARIKVVPTGFEHGTITLVMPSGPVEVTTLRIDLETYGRHATVALGTSFKEDAARRDFTINAMFEDRQGTVLDFFGGQNDLNAGVLRFVGDPGTRIKEDYLRIMRLFRFWARFAFKPAVGTLEAVVEHRDGLNQISQERITYELRRIFESPVADQVLMAMKSTGVLAIILPELCAGNLSLPDQTGLQHLQKIKLTAERPMLVLGLLLALNHLNSSEQIKDMATRLRLSKQDGRKLMLLAELPEKIANTDGSQSAAMSILDQCDDVFGSEQAWEQTIRFFLASVSNGNAAKADLEKIILRWDALENKKSHLRKADLPVSVPEIMSLLKLAPGPDVGVIAESLRASFRDEECFSKPEAISWLQKNAPRLILKKQ